MITREIYLNKDNYPKILLTLDYDQTIIDGILKINVIDWLLEK
jgi:predicted AAA+ superfamily ATPase